MDAIAIRDAANIPSLSGWGSFILSLILLAAVIVVLKRKKEVLG